MEHKYADVVLHQAWSSVIAQDLQTERGKLEVKILMQKEGDAQAKLRGGILTKGDIKQRCQSHGDETKYFFLNEGFLFYKHEEVKLWWKDPYRYCARGSSVIQVRARHNRAEKRKFFILRLSKVDTFT